MDITKYHGKGYSGLANLGNTCFLNACMQCISHTYELNEFLSSKKCERLIKTNIPDSLILTEWNDLREVMWSTIGVISPNKFVYNVQKLARDKDRDIFTGWAQNDMPEFLLFMIECMHNSISRSVGIRITGNVENKVDLLANKCYGMLKTAYSKDYSEIMDMYYAIYVSEIASLNGSVQHSIKPESFFMLDLPLPTHGRPNKTLHECFDEFTRPEIMEGDNAWYNDVTQQKENVSKRITFWNLPKILVITLKRFSADGSHKMNDLVTFPLENLDLSSFVSGYNASQYIYDVFGVCNHMGDCMGGHYTAFVRNSSNEWLHCNDTHVEILRNTKNVVSPSAYCLFLRRKNNLV